MCNFASFLIAADAPKVKDTKLWVYDLLSHSECYGFYNLVAGSYREVEWTGETEKSLVVRVESGEDSNAYRACILAMFKTRNDFLLWAYPRCLRIVCSNPGAMEHCDFTKARTVYASGCQALTKLDAPEATYVDASGCQALTKLDAPKADKLGRIYK